MGPIRFSPPVGTPSLATLVVCAAAASACGSSRAAPPPQKGADAPLADDDAPIVWPAHVAPTSGATTNTDDDDPQYTIYEHGRDCYEAMDQHALPRITCTEGTLLPVTKDGVEYVAAAPDTCDRPSLGDSRASCVPGARLRVQESDEPDPSQRVVSVFLCQRLRSPGASPSTRDLSSPWQEDIAVFQYNRRNEKVCWFQIRRPHVGVQAVGLPSPYEPGRQPGDADDVAAKALYVAPGVLAKGEPCIACHDSQVFVRTPFVEQPKHQGLRNGLGATDIWSDAEALHGRLRHVGLPFARWNTDDSQPARIRVASSEYDALYPMTPAEQQDWNAGALASAGACGACHSIGKSPLKSPSADEGSCDDLLRYWVDKTYVGPVTGAFLSDTAKSFPASHWMPPGAAARFPSQAAFERYYRRALRAVARCCLKPDMMGPGGTQPCSDGWKAPPN
jgi:hypothetical protein